MHLRAAEVTAMQHVTLWNTSDRLAEQPRWAHRALLGILAFEAAGAFIGGPALIAAPDGHLMQIPLQDLRGVFPDFLVPGLILTGLGLLNAVAFVVLLLKRPIAWLPVGLALFGFLIWFVVELSICGAKSWAQAAWAAPVPVGIVLALPLALERFVHPPAEA